MNAVLESDFQGTPDPREPDYVLWACVSALAVLVLHLFYIITHL